MFPYQDPSRSVEERTEDLLSRLTLEEKFVQMHLITLPVSQVEDGKVKQSHLDNSTHRLGSLYNTTTLTADEVNRVQQFGLDHSRLKIPMIIHSETLHGYMNDNATVFPQAIGMGSTFNRELVSEVVSCIGKEARSNGVRVTYSPNLDLSRDPRWGRVEENYGEDTYLTGEMGKTYINAMQAQGVACCVKHYIAHGSPERGINLGPVHAGEREFREVMLEPFRKAIQEAGAKMVMPAYSELDGEPVHGSYRLLTELLRNELGFEGQVISDFNGVKMLHQFHRSAADPRTAGEQALRAGVDLEAPLPYGFDTELMEDVRSGKVPMELVDQAVRRILKLKFELGVFEDPWVHEEDFKIAHSDEAVALSRRAATESVILLKNEGGLLPLCSNVGKVALLGPNADNPQLGGYTPQNAMKKAVTLRRAMEEALGKDRILFAQGCTIAGGTEEMKQEALQIAQQADVVVMVMGDNGNYYGGIGWGNAEPDGTVAVTCGEGFDTHTLELPGRQQRLLEAVCAVGKPVVLILESGRPYAIPWAAENIPAILQAWYPGEQGGYALCDLLLGKANPSGRLPISMPRSVGHLPCYYNHKYSSCGYYNRPGSPDNPGRDYVFSSPDVVYSFGHGLSYTTFAYSDLKVQEKAGIHDTVSVSVTVENTGDRAGQEVVQLYLSDLYCRIAPYVRRLRGFEKIALQPGEKKTVTFTLGFDDFSFINEQMKPEVEPGEFKICIGDQEKIITLE